MGTMTSVPGARVISTLTLEKVQEMSDLIDVMWNASEDDVWITQKHLTILPPWAGIASNAEAVAASVMENYFDPIEWFERYGDDHQTTVDVEIISPEAVAGKFRVKLEQKIKASAAKA